MGRGVGRRRAGPGGAGDGTGDGDGVLESVLERRPCPSRFSKLGCNFGTGPASALRLGPTHLLRARAASHKRVLGPQLWPERVGLEEGHSVAVPVERRHERVVAVGVLVRVLKRAPVHLPDTM